MARFPFLGDRPNSMQYLISNRDGLQWKSKYKFKVTFSTFLDSAEKTAVAKIYSLVSNILNPANSTP